MKLSRVLFPGSILLCLQVSTLEFSRDRKMMSVLCQAPQNQAIIFVKGAPEAVLAQCSHVSPALFTMLRWYSVFVLASMISALAAP